ncbi:hypothetical protein [Ottowia testudinis]|uniref:Uncharacterized protein n=1 Tax=Ottowia testudinis TaxID=2816950 RepID=A0A975H4P1_9BURK|nr:hypothetical protein [Ottowia testudinis]QTD47088.1 hypothetical protein J1M35_09590 [Ottowia testudinis]
MTAHGHHYRGRRRLSARDEDRDLDAGAWPCGMVAGLIHAIPALKQLIDRLVTKARQIVPQRLAALA